MYHFSHAIKENKGVERPLHVVFFDTETQSRPIANNKERLTLGLGYAAYYRRTRRGDYALHADKLFYTPSDFVAFLDKCAPPNSRLWVIAHNLDFDLQAASVLPLLSRLDWLPLFTALEKTTRIIKVRKEHRTLYFMDWFNVFKMSLRDLGDMVGVKKGDIDFDHNTPDELAAYCKRDVEILSASFMHYCEFLDRYKLGNFSPSASGQALNAFRHRYMSHTIYVHTNRKAIAFEREGYYGGRTEAFYMGRLEGIPLYNLDVNSMYPSVMAELVAPRKLLYYERNTKRDIEKLLSPRRYVIARVALDTPEAAYPLRMNDRLIFPVGCFSTVLPQSELLYALEHKHVVKVFDIAVYEASKIFSRYVAALYAMRQRARHDHNRPYELFIKLLMNGLYGKFGQKAGVWEHIGHDDTVNFTSRTVYTSKGKQIKERVLFGEAERLVGSSNSINTLVAIPAAVTSAARMRLWSLIQTARRDHVYYVDTDSLIVDEAGYYHLQGELSTTGELGKLKLVSRSDFLDVRGLKDYTFGDTEHIKGISPKAKRLGPNTFEQIQFRSLLGAIDEGELSSVTLSHVTKHLKREYSKGEILPSGRVLPYRL